MDTSSAAAVSAPATRSSSPCAIRSCPGRSGCIDLVIIARRLPPQRRQTSPRSPRPRVETRQCGLQLVRLPIMTMSAVDLIVLHEHPEWQKPLFAALERRGVSFGLRRHARGFQQRRGSARPLYFNQASPSAYLRGHTRAVPLALAYMRSLELLGARVLNGADVFALELSKSAQATLLRTLGIERPRSITFNDVAALRQFAGDVRWPALLKPDQGGSGARIQVVESLAQVEAIFSAIRASGSRTTCSFSRNTSHTTPTRASSAWNSSAASSSTRCASRRTAASTCVLRLSAIRRTARGVRNAREGRGAPGRVLSVPGRASPKPCDAKRIVQAARLDVGGIEYLETDDGRRVFYDINANSNLRPSVAAAFGFDPFSAWWTTPGGGAAEVAVGRSAVVPHRTRRRERFNRRAHEARRNSLRRPRTPRPH